LTDDEDEYERECARFVNYVQGLAREIAECVEGDLSVKGQVEAAAGDHLFVRMTTKHG
jgi:hypothetical protein